MSENCFSGVMKRCQKMIWPAWKMSENNLAKVKNVRKSLDQNIKMTNNTYFKKTDIFTPVLFYWNNITNRLMLKKQISEFALTVVEKLSGTPIWLRVSPPPIYEPKNGVILPIFVFWS